MDFWLLDVKSTVNINGKDVAFDYINTYFEKNDAIRDAKLLSMDNDVLEVSVHHWILLENGEQEHVDDVKGGIEYRFLNENHRELK